MPSLADLRADAGGWRVVLAGARALRQTDPQACAARMQQGGTYAGDPFAKALQASRDAVTRIQNDRTMSPDDKRAAIDLTYLSMIELAKRGLEVFERTKRTPKKGYVRGGLVTTGYKAA
jgi:hypothetical protein